MARENAAAAADLLERLEDLVDEPLGRPVQVFDD